MDYSFRLSGLVQAAAGNGEAELNALVEFCCEVLESGQCDDRLVAQCIQAMANAARTDIGRQEVLAKAQVVLGKEWQTKALAENYLIEICRFVLFNNG